MPAKPPYALGVVEACAALEAGILTSEALVRSCLERVAERDAQVHAFVALDEELALRAARAADASPVGLLRGIPFAAKDVIDTVDLPTAHGSAIYAGRRPAADAACVALAREQGAVLLGKVATSEFATQTPGPTRNPLDLERTPGGSSSGSAAAVADCMVPLAFGTQTTGSISRPAAYCGVVGYKPTHGLISSAGVKALSSLQDTVGVLARSVEDAAFFAYGLLGLRDTLSDPGPVRLAVCESSQWQHASREMIAAIEAAATRWAGAGLRVSRIVLPADLEQVAQAQSRVVAYEARQSLAFERLQHHGQLSSRLRARLAAGADVSFDEYLALRRQVRHAQQLAAALFAQHDVLLYPAADGAAEPGLSDSGSPRFGALWTLLQLPTVCFPVGRSTDGLPLGAQFVGPFCGDRALLQAAHWAARLLSSV
jgi:Asp-tRNA(Asn)/Glu-tRNA(Gln) amidotransferase A subunit family amidase